MPYAKVNGRRNYRKEYEAYQGKPDQIKKRSQRNQARAMLAKAKGAAAIKGKDVAHAKAISKGGTNSLANLFAEPAAKNRSFHRNGDSSLKSERSKRERKR